MTCHDCVLALPPRLQCIHPTLDGNNAAWLESEQNETVQTGDKKESDFPTAMQMEHDTRV
jgi:hypothetical protein